MERTPNGWLIHEAERPVLTREYSFGPGLATSLVIGLASGRLLAVSPASGLPETAHQDLSRYGDVVALLAPNAFHYLGVESWLKQWPNAHAYAAPESLQRLNSKCSAGAVFEPLSAFGPLPDGVLIDNPPGLRSSDLVLRVHTAKGWLWYFNDLLMNLRSLPTQPLVRLLFALTGARTGLSAPTMPKLLHVRDKHATGRWLLSEIDARPPALVVFGHGDSIAGSNLGMRLKSVISQKY